MTPAAAAADQPPRTGVGYAWSRGGRVDDGSALRSASSTSVRAPAWSARRCSADTRFQPVHLGTCVWACAAMHCLSRCRSRALRLAQSAALICRARARSCGGDGDVHAPRTPVRPRSTSTTSHDAWSMCRYLGSLRRADWAAVRSAAATAQDPLEQRVPRWARPKPERCLTLGGIERRSSVRPSESAPELESL